MVHVRRAAHKRADACYPGPMRALVVALVLALSASASAATCTPCGDERWQIKTLSDRDAVRVRTTPVRATISELGALPRPRVRASFPRFGPAEFTTYVIAGCLRGWKIEDDNDLHLVIVDGVQPGAATIIAEVPDPACEGVCRTRYGGAYADIRRRMTDAFGEPAVRLRRLRRMPRVEITGVGFFDVVHGQTGRAPNAIELHPVLSMVQHGWCGS